MSLLDLFAAMGDDLRAPTQPAKKPAKQAPSQAQATPPKRAPSTWRPLSLVIWQAEWRCTCGACGLDAPIVMLREDHGDPASKFYQQRLRRVDSVAAFPLLPVDAEIAPPQLVKACAACITPVLRTPQLSLDLDLPPIEPPLYHQPPLEKLFADYAEMRINAASSVNLAA